MRRLIQLVNRTRYENRLPGQPAKYLGEPMHKSKVPAKERLFLKSMESRLGLWNRRDFTKELKNAVYIYQRKLKDLGKSGHPAGVVLEELDKAEHEYRRVFGDFCGLMSSLKPLRLAAIESKFMEVSGEKEETDSSSKPIHKVVLSVLRSSESHSPEQVALALQWSRKNSLISTSRKSKSLRKLQSSRLEINYLESKYEQAIDKEKQSILFSSKDRLAGLPRVCLSHLPWLPCRERGGGRCPWT
jgi:hypothetical protein